MILRQPCQKKRPILNKNTEANKDPKIRKMNSRSIACSTGGNSGSRRNGVVVEESFEAKARLPCVDQGLETRKTPQHMKTQSRLKFRAWLVDNKKIGPATTQNLVVKFDGEICGGGLVENASDNFPQQKKLENLLPNFAGSSPRISPKTSPTPLWKSLVLKKGTFGLENQFRSYRSRLQISSILPFCSECGGLCFARILWCPCKNAVLRRVLRRSFKSKGSLEGLLEGACEGSQSRQGS